MVYGTSYFPTKSDIYKYYGVLGYSGKEIQRKITEKEVHVGCPPNLNVLRRAVLAEDQGGSVRWFIFEDTRL